MESITQQLDILNEDLSSLEKVDLPQREMPTQLPHGLIPVLGLTQQLNAVLDHDLGHTKHFTFVQKQRQQGHHMQNHWRVL